MSQQIPQVDQAMLETTLDRMVRKTVEEMYFVKSVFRV